MKHYPSIGTKIPRDVEVVCYDKLDGSNIRAEWSRKKTAFYKFGSRQQLLDPRDPVLGRAPELIRAKYERQLNEVLTLYGYESAVCFFEFFGPSSFAGQHDVNEKHDVVLFDIAPYKKGIVGPGLFHELTTGMHIPTIVYRGPFTPEIEESVRDGSLGRDDNFYLKEGVVGKPLSGAPPFKVKTRTWLERLKERCGSNEALFKKLA